MVELRPLRRAVRVGLLGGAVLFVAVLAGGPARIVGWTATGDFYDAQAHALLHGRLDVDPDVLSIEAFLHNGKAYLYQPPFPALLRLPVVAATDDLDGRLSGLSMLLALGVLALGAEALLLEAVRALAPAAPAGRLAQLLAFAYGLAAIAAAPPVFLASRAWVYHEAALWGLAWSVAAFAALLRLVRRPTTGATVVTLACVAGAVLSRVSVGLGPVAAALLLAGHAAWQHRGGATPDEPRGPSPLALAGIGLTPILVYMAINLAKFDSLVSVPLSQQAFTLSSPRRQAVLAANDGSLFGPQFAPTTLLHYLRPDGVSFGATFPYVDFQAPGSPIVGDVQFDLVDRAGSITATMTALLLATIAGAWLVWRARRRAVAPGAVAATGLGAAAGAAAIVPFGYIAHRYLADVTPLLLVGTAAFVALAPFALRGASWRRAVAVAVIGLVALGVTTQVGLGLRYAGIYAPNPSPARAAAFVRAQRDIGRWVGRPPSVREAEALDGGGTTDLIALHDCAAMYADAGGGVWVPVERTAAAGHARLRVDVAGLPDGERTEVATSAGPDPVTLWLERDGDDVRAGLRGATDEAVGRPQPIRGRTAIDLTVDRDLGTVVARLGDQPVVAGSIAAGPPATIEITGPGTPLPVEDGALCRSLVDD